VSTLISFALFGTHGFYDEGSGGWLGSKHKWGVLTSICLFYVDSVG
jgi:hypothetical protein